MSANGRRVGIRDVAAAAGVSATTVSHALNGKGRLPEETRDRVRRVAEELGYRPNATARNLAGGKTGLLAIVVSQPPDGPLSTSDFAYFSDLMSAASTTALRRGYALVLTPRGGEIGPHGIAVDGAIVVDPVHGDPLVSDLRREGMPVVTAGRSVDADGPQQWVDNDHVAGAQAVLDHLHRQGAERTALLTLSTVMSYTIDVEHAYRTWCAEHGVEPRIAKVGQELTESAGFAAATELLSLADPPDAIYASYDRIAYGALLAAQARGVRVPQDLMLAMTATEATTRSAGPAITALNLFPSTIGERAAELLIDLIEEWTPDDEHVVVPTRLVTRGSTRRGSTRAA
jgi:DNA-binding LacI/PurR family transcriptional regulator